MSKGPQLTFREGLALIVAFVVAFGALAVTSAGADVQTEVCDKTGIFIKEDLKSDGYEVGDVIVLNDESNPLGLSMEATITSIKDDGEPLTIEYGDPPEGYEIDSTCEKVGKNENAAISHVVVYLTEVTETETPSPTPTSTPSPTSTGTPSPTPTPSQTITPPTSVPPAEPAEPIQDEPSYTG